MKIGIITIHKSNVNYGASLQCYALWKYITDLGHHAEVIDLRRPVLRGYHFDCNLEGLKKKYQFRVKPFIRQLGHFLHGLSHINRLRRFHTFNNTISYSQIYHNYTELQKKPPLYDIYLSGSDQIWNPHMPFDNKPYLLSFVHENKTKVSYASSFGVDNLPNEVKKEYSDLLSQYKYLSTRELSGKRIIDELLSKNIPTVLDPIFLLAKNEWFLECDQNYHRNENFILVYSLHLNQELINLAILISKQTNLKIYVILSCDTYYKNKDVVFLYDAGPRQWLNLIRNAKIFLTDSFHGTAFANLFKTPYLSYINNLSKNNNRILTLLELLHQGSHIVSYPSYTYQNINKLIDKAYQFLPKNEEYFQREREKSILYLKTILQ